MPPKGKDITSSYSSRDGDHSSETSQASGSTERLTRLRSMHRYSAPSHLEDLQERLKTLAEQTEQQADKEDIENFCSSVGDIQAMHADDSPEFSHQLLKKIESVTLFATNEEFLRMLDSFKQNMNAKQSIRGADTSTHLDRLNQLPFLPSQNPQEDRDASHDAPYSYYAEQGRTDPEAIHRLAQIFADAAKTKPPDGKRRPSLGIRISDDQFTLVRQIKDPTLDPEIQIVAYDTAYNASDLGRARCAAYRATDKGKARNTEASQRYRQTDKGIEAQKRAAEKRREKNREKS